MLCSQLVTVRLTYPDEDDARPGHSHPFSFSLPRITLFPAFAERLEYKYFDMIMVVL